MAPPGSPYAGGRVVTGTVTPEYSDDKTRRGKSKYRVHDEDLNVTGMATAADEETAARSALRSAPTKTGVPGLFLGATTEPVFVAPGVVVTSTVNSGFSPRNAQSKSRPVPTRQLVSAGAMMPSKAGGDASDTFGFAPMPRRGNAVRSGSRPSTSSRPYSVATSSVSFDLPPVPQPDLASKRRSLASSDGTRPEVLIDGTAEDLSKSVETSSVPRSSRKVRTANLKALERLSQTKAPKSTFKNAPNMSYNQVMSLFKTAGGLPSFKRPTGVATVSSDSLPHIVPERRLSAKEQANSASRLAKNTFNPDKVNPGLSNQAMAKSAGVVFGDIVQPKSKDEQEILTRVGQIRNDASLKNALEESVRLQRVPSGRQVDFEYDAVRANAMRNTHATPWDDSTWTGGARPRDPKEWERVCESRDVQRMEVRIRAQKVREEMLQRKMASANRHDVMRAAAETKRAEEEARARTLRNNRFLAAFVVFTRFQVPLRARLAKKKEDDASLELRTGAAIVVQSAARKFLTSTRFNKVKSAISFIQIYFRSHVAGRADDRRKKYANLLVDFLTEYEKSNDLKVKLQMLKVRVMTMQRGVRLYILRRRAQIELCVQQWTRLEKAMIDKRDYNRQKERERMGASSIGKGGKVSSKGGKRAAAVAKEKNIVKDIFDDSQGSPTSRPSTRGSHMTADASASVDGPSTTYALIIKDTANMIPEQRFVPIELKRLIIDAVMKLRLYVFMYMKDAHEEAKAAYDEAWYKEDAMHEAKVMIGAADGPLPYEPPRAPRWRVMLPQAELRAAMAEGVAYNDTWRKMWSHAQLGTRDLPPRARLVKERLSGLFDRLEAMNVQTAIQMCPKEHIVDWYPPNLASTGLMGAQADVRAAPKKVEH
ncbi:hypothetical protein RI054_01g05000 [Pseudoscourfieldia marina]